MSIDFPSNDANFKAVISGDLIQLEPKNRDFYACRPTCSMLLCSNGLPKFPRAASPIMDRLRLIKLSKTFGANPDKNLGNKLRAEMSGIFNWILKYYNELRQANWEIPETRGMASDKKEWFSEMDSVWQFLDSKVWVSEELLRKRRKQGHSGLYSMPIRDLWECYNKWIVFQDVISRPKRERFVESLLTKMKCGRVMQNTVVQTKAKACMDKVRFDYKNGYAFAAVRIDEGHVSFLLSNSREEDAQIIFSPEAIAQLGEWING